MRIHHRVEEAVLGSIVSGARQRNVGASQELIDRHLPPPRLGYADVCDDAELLDADLDVFLDDFDQRQGNLAGYFRIRMGQRQGEFVVANSSSASDTLTGATSEAASDITLHSMTMDGDMMKMAPVEGGLEVPAGGNVALSPMGFHLMMVGMEQPFVAAPAPVLLERLVLLAQGGVGARDEKRAQGAIRGDVGRHEPQPRTLGRADPIRSDPV